MPGVFAADLMVLAKYRPCSRMLRSINSSDKALTQKTGAFVRKITHRDQAIIAFNTDGFISSNDKSNDKTLGRKIDGFIVQGELESRAMSVVRNIQFNMTVQIEVIR